MISKEEKESALFYLKGFINKIKSDCCEIEFYEVSMDTEDYIEKDADYIKTVPNGKESLTIQIYNPENDKSKELIK